MPVGHPAGFLVARVQHEREQIVAPSAASTAPLDQAGHDPVQAPQRPVHAQIGRRRHHNGSGNALAKRELKVSCTTVNACCPSQTSGPTSTPNKVVAISRLRRIGRSPPPRDSPRPTRSASPLRSSPFRSPIVLPVTCGAVVAGLPGLWSLTVGISLQITEAGLMLPVVVSDTRHYGSCMWGGNLDGSG